MPQEYQHELPNPEKFNLRGLLLYVLPAPLILKLLISIVALSPMKLLLSAAALFFFYSAAHLTRVTLLNLAANHRHPKPTKVKDYRLWSMIYIGVGLLILMFLIRRPMFASLIMVACGMIGYYLTYGLRAPEPEAPVDFDAMPKATREAIQGAYADLERIETLALQLSDDNDKAITDNVNQVVKQSYKILSLLSRSPNDAGRARRFLSVYTNRIKEILEQYLNLSQHGKADDFRQRLQAVLAETHKAFNQQESKLLDDDQFKLDVQLEVLDEQIKNEQK